MGRFFFILVMIVSAAVIPMVRDAEALQAPELTVNEYKDAVGLIYQVTNNLPLDSVDAIFIGAASPNGTPQGPLVNVPGWGGMLLHIEATQGSSNEWDAYSGQGADKVIVLKGLGGSYEPSWSAYVGGYGYLFWGSSTNAIPGRGNGLFYVDGGTLSSPWADIHDPTFNPFTEKTYIDPTNGNVEAPPGYGVSAQGVTYQPQDTPPPRPVPVPSALLLLGPGLVGLAALKRRITK